MSFSTRRTALVVSGVAALALTAPVIAMSTASAQPGHVAKKAAKEYVISSGKTTLVPNAATLGKYKAAGFTLTPTSEATQSKKGVLTFPVTGGVLNPKSHAGVINHVGGLTVTPPSTNKDPFPVVSRDYSVNTKTGALTAYVDGLGKFTLFDLVKVTKAKTTYKKGTLTISKIKVVLDKGSAAALDTTYSTTVFKGGQVIGVLKTVDKASLVTK
jgi:hypothetical protein